MHICHMVRAAFRQCPCSLSVAVPRCALMTPAVCLFSERCPFSLQKATFCTPKSRLLEPETWPFATR